jgi:hypothetical protein
VRLLRPALAAVGLMTVAASAFVASEWRASAADHFDPPSRTDPLVNPNFDLAVDIADIYVWHTTDFFTMAFTFAGPQAMDRPPTYDPDVLYTINISNAGAPVDPEIQIRFRFGRDAQGNVGVQIMGLPDNPAAPLIGPVEQTLTRSGIQARAGLYDDPFFFDVEGFRATRASGTLMFDKNRSLFSTQNDTAMVMQLPIGFVRNGSNQINVWVTTARIAAGQ